MLKYNKSIIYACIVYVIYISNFIYIQIYNNKLKFIKMLIFIIKIRYYNTKTLINYD